MRSEVPDSAGECCCGHRGWDGVGVRVHERLARRSQRDRDARRDARGPPRSGHRARRTGQRGRTAHPRRTAVADTIAGIVTVPGDEMVFVLGAALTGAVAWNAITWWRALPSSSGHALLGGLVGAALAEGGTGAVNWGGFDGIKPVGVLGVMGVHGVGSHLRASGGPRREPMGAACRAPRHESRAGAGARRAVDDVGRAGIDPWSERCTEVDRHRGRAALRGGRRPRTSHHRCGRSLRAVPRSPRAPRSAAGRSSVRSVDASLGCDRWTRCRARRDPRQCSSEHR